MITYLIIGISAILSAICFQNNKLFSKLRFNPALIIHRKEYYRLITHAFIHANWSHLLLNMLVLYFFGNTVEIFFAHYFGNLATLYFLLLYFGGILFSNLWSLRKYKNNYNYNAVGASGAVASVLFAFIFFAPWEMLYLFGILPIPGIIFGVGYLFYSLQMTKQNQDHIAHDAHLLGAVFGFILPILLNPKLFSRFTEELFSIF